MSDVIMCAADFCNAPHFALGMCEAHYGPWRLPAVRTAPPLPSARQGLGAVAEAAPVRSRPACSAEGCESASRARGMCEMHYRRVRQNGSPHRYRDCAICDERFDGHGGALTCSDRCRAEYRRQDARSRVYPDWESVPRTPCATCGGPTGYRDTSKNRRRKPVCRTCFRSRPTSPDRWLRDRWGAISLHVCMGCDVVWQRRRTKGHVPAYCSDCREFSRPHIPNAVRRGVYERDGWVCQICSDPVDGSLIGSDSPLRPSLDHVVPFSRGGSDGAENLRLAHLGCNAGLRDRVDFL